MGEEGIEKPSSLYAHTHTHTHTHLTYFVWDYPGEPVTER